MNSSCQALRPASGASTGPFSSGSPRPGCASSREPQLLRKVAEGGWACSRQGGQPPRPSLLRQPPTPAVPEGRWGLALLVRLPMGPRKGLTSSSYHNTLSVRATAALIQTLVFPVMGRQVGCRHGWIQGANGSALLCTIILLSAAAGHGSWAQRGKPLRVTATWLGRVLPGFWTCPPLWAAPRQGDRPGRLGREVLCVLWQLWLS